MSDRGRDEEDLRATSDSVVSTAERIAALEHEKTQLAPNDPRVSQLSAEIEQLAARLKRETEIERSIADDLRDSERRPIH